VRWCRSPPPRSWRQRCCPPARTLVLVPLAGRAWCAAVLGFLLRYGPILLARHTGGA